MNSWACGLLLFFSIAACAVGPAFAGGVGNNETTVPTLDSLWNSKVRIEKSIELETAQLDALLIKPQAQRTDEESAKIVALPKGIKRMSARLPKLGGKIDEMLKNFSDETPVIQWMSEHGYGASVTSGARLAPIERSPQYEYVKGAYAFFRSRQEHPSAASDEAARSYIESLFKASVTTVLAMKQNGRFGELAKMIASDPVWKKADPRLIADFASEYAPVWMDLDNRTMAKALGKLDPKSKVMRDFLYENSPEKDDRFGMRYRKVQNMIPLLLEKPPYAGTAEGEKLLNPAYARVKTLC